MAGVLAVPRPPTPTGWPGGAECAVRRCCAPAYVDQVRPVADRKKNPRAAQTPTEPCRPSVRRRPLVPRIFRSARRRLNQSTRPPPAITHNQLAANSLYSRPFSPRCRLRVELVDPGAHRQRAGRSVLFERASHLGGVRVDEHREGVLLVHAGDARTASPWWWRRPPARDVRRRPCPPGVPCGRRRPARRSAASRRLRGTVSSCEYRTFSAWKDPAYRNPVVAATQQERGDEHSGIEVQPQHQRAQRRPDAAFRGGVDGGCGASSVWSWERWTSAGFSGEAGDDGPDSAVALQ